MKKATWSRLIALVLYLSCWTFAHADGLDALKTRLDAVVDRSINEDRLVGAVVLVSQDGKVIYEKSVRCQDCSPAFALGLVALSSSILQPPARRNLEVLGIGAACMDTRGS